MMRLRRWILPLVLLGFAGLAVLWLLTMPRTVVASALPQHTADLANGELLFHAGGCASCHASPAATNACDGKYADGARLSGGRCLKTPFGTFSVPNISNHKTDGIGAWTDAQFVTAMREGVGIDGEHLYPSFPYSSYRNMTLPDLLDLRAYLATLPVVAGKAPPHSLPLPFQVRRGVGMWKLLYLRDQPPDTLPETASAEIKRGAYLVNGPGHCGECHTQRDALGGPMPARHLAGGPAPEGEGWIPNITPAADGLAAWSAADVEEMLSTGTLPDFDSVGGSMVAVQENMAKLPVADRKAIAAYLKSLPPIANPRPKK
jgi:mono/diheme cytochrome c family protein